jgi:hypothetical protein
LASTDAAKATPPAAAQGNRSRAGTNASSAAVSGNSWKDSAKPTRLFVSMK